MKDTRTDREKFRAHLEASHTIYLENKKNDYIVNEPPETDKALPESEE